MSVVAALALAGSALATLANPPAASLSGRVLAGGEPAPGVTIVVTRDGQVLAETTTDGEGRYRLENLAPGTARVSARIDGFAPAERSVELRAGERSEVDLALEVGGRAEYVEVSPVPRAAENTASPVETLDGLLLERVPAGGTSVDDALTAMPGVLRVDAGLGLRGGRPQQTGMQLGSMSLTDPGTGESRVRMPVDAVAGVEVLASPTAAEFGRFGAGLVLLHPRTGGERWSFALNNLEPALRTRRGNPLEILGIRSFAPRLALRGPLQRGRLYLAQSVQYRYTVADVRSRPEDELRKQEFVSAVTRLDLRSGPRHHTGLLLSAFPETRTQTNLSTFQPPATTWDQRAGVYNVSLTHDAVVGSSAVLSTGFHVGRQTLRLGPPARGTLAQHPLENGGRWFNSQRRESTSVQLVPSLSLLRRGPWGEHDLRLGLDLFHVDFAGESTSDPIELRRLDGSLARRIGFGPRASFALASTDVALFARDRWRPRPDLAIELALRLDRDGVLGDAVLAPRLGAVFFSRGGRWRLAASAGVFTERTPSLVGVFESLEARREQRFAADGRTLVSDHLYRPQAAADLATARCTAVTARATWQVASHLELSAGGLLRRGRRELVIDPVTAGGDARLLLRGDGRSRYRELELSARLTPRPGTELAASWIASRSEADLNAFAALFGTARPPLIQPVAWGPADFDVPQRLLLRLSSAIGEDWALTSVFDAQRGTPWTALTPDGDVAGARNRAGRFPTATVLDVSVERRVRVRKWQPWVGLGVAHLLGTFVPRDVQAFVEAPGFGGFFDPAPRRLRFFVRLAR
ncbi:MAG: TonB-dependent receptor [Vicinamibacteria bacterium]|nr:TonB-dependent receptor [Vicinamibacteria bacterium]